MTTETSTPEPARDGGGAVGVICDGWAVLAPGNAVLVEPTPTGALRIYGSEVEARSVRRGDDTVARVTVSHATATPPAAVGEVAPSCTVCGAVATRQDIDGDWWPPCGHAKEHGVNVLRTTPAPAGGDSQRTINSTQTDSSAGGDVAAAVGSYDAGLLGDGGGGNVEWWQTYIRDELARAHDHYAAAHEAAVRAAREGVVADLAFLVPGEGDVVVRVSAELNRLQAERARAEALGARCERLEKIVGDVATTLLVLGSIEGEQGHYEAGVIDAEEMTTPAERERIEEDHSDALAAAIGWYCEEQDRARAAETAGATIDTNEGD